MTAARLLIAALLLLLALVAAIAGSAPAATQPARLGDCLPPLLRPVYGRTPLSDTDMAALRALPVLDTFWRGYDSPTPFDLPPDATSAGSVRGHVVGGDPDFYDAGIDFLRAASAPGVVYALVYADLTPDAPGTPHEGTHPCAAVTLDAGDWQAWRAGATGDGVGR